MTVLRACYKNGVRFDHEYYASKHLPLVSSIMGPYGMTSIEVVRMESTVDGAAPPYQVIFSAYFETPAALQNALQSARMGEVLGVIPNYHGGTPDLWIGEVVALPSLARAL